MQVPHSHTHKICKGMFIILSLNVVIHPDKTKVYHKPAQSNFHLFNKTNQT
jgi:hypothetical protein